jgi:hypothetical protein
MTNTYTFIYLYLIFGASFGFATYSKRHLFSEGPQKTKASNETASLASRIYWIILCTLLWPILVLTGINTAWVLFKRKKQAQKK